MQATKTACTAPATGGVIHSIRIADLKIVHAPDRVRTVLGSCVGVAIYDRVSQIGGLAHVILPESTEGAGDPGKFADTAVDMLIEEAVGAGADRRRLVAKISGGASMFCPVTENGLGERNAAAVRARLHHHAIRIAGEAVGGRKGRKMLLDPATGEVTVEVIGASAQIV